MTKKDKKKVKVETVTTKDGETIKVFEELEDFEGYIKEGFEDGEFERVHCRVNYYPPFVLQHHHNDPEKVGDLENSHNKKFVRHLHQHVEKHLLHDIRDALDLPDLKFKGKSKDESFEKIVWHYNQEVEARGKKFYVNIDVTTNHDDAMAHVDYHTSPI